METYEHHSEDVWLVVVNDCSGPSWEIITDVENDVVCRRSRSVRRPSKILWNGSYKSRGVQRKIYVSTQRRHATGLVKFAYKGTIDHTFGEDDFAGELVIRSLQSEALESGSIIAALPINFAVQRGQAVKFAMAPLSQQSF
jgi:hypothetical protein